MLSPCGFIATNYMILGRLARHLGHGDYLFISPTRVTTVFVWSDVTTFLIQAAGGGISTGNSHAAATLGSNVSSIFNHSPVVTDRWRPLLLQLFVAGLGIQLASYLLFTSLFLSFLYRVRSKSPETWTSFHEGQSSQRWWRDWRGFAFAIFISSVGVIVSIHESMRPRSHQYPLTLHCSSLQRLQIRSIFRVIEGTQGYFGPLATNQAAFFLLDSLPLFIAVSIYIPFWPGQFIDSHHLRQEQLALKDGVRSSHSP